MARVNAYSAFARAGTSSGLAKAVAEPTYLERVAAEPALRRLVPVMIVAFLLAAWSGAAVQMSNGRNEAVAAAQIEMDLVASLTSIDLSIELARAAPSLNADTSLHLMAALPPHAMENNRAAFFENGEGRITGRTANGFRATTLDELLGAAQPLVVLADKAGVMRVRLPGGIEALATVRALPNRMGRLALIQPVWDATRIWRERALSLSLLALASTLVIGALGVAFFQQSARAAEADVVCAQVRSRIDSVLGSGRSGLWDWDIARGRIFVSDSFYALLGRERADDFLSFADIRDWVHPDDEAPFGGSDAGPADGRIEREFRMLHAEGRWIWICIRGCLTTDQPAHLVGIAVDITDEKAEAEVRLRPTSACAMRSRASRRLSRSSTIRRCSSSPIRATSACSRCRRI